MRLRRVSLTVKPQLLIDADPFTYRAGFSCNEEHQLEESIEKLDSLIEDCMYHLDYDGCQLYLTGKGNFRYEIAVTHGYKENRKDVEKPIHLQSLRNHVMDNWDGVMSEGEEADDMIAIAATEYGPKAIIASIDKDFLQVPCFNYNPYTGLLKSVSEFEGLKFFYTQILTGDKADNIIGLYGIGPKRADKILAGCETEDDLYFACLDAYNNDKDRLVENGRLLWLRRYEGQVWEPPS